MSYLPRRLLLGGTVSQRSIFDVGGFRMAKELVAEDLVSACAEDGRAAGIKMWAVLEPLGGAGAPVRPAIYEGGRFQQDRRWWGQGDLRREVQVIVIDNVPSQANRLEASLERLRPELGLPELALDLSEAAGLPPHLPRRISSFRFPHRQADAYLRDAMLAGRSSRSRRPARPFWPPPGSAPRLFSSCFHRRCSSVSGSRIWARSAPRRSWLGPGCPRSSATTQRPPRLASMRSRGTPST